MDYKILKADKEFLIVNKESSLPKEITHNNVVYVHFRDGLFFSTKISDNGMARIFENLVNDFDYEDNYISKEYNHYVYSKVISITKNYLGNLKVENILDYGCGTGIGYDIIHSEFPKSNIYGFDLSKKMVEIAETRGFIPIYEKDNIINIHGNSIDLVIGIFILGLIQSEYWLSEIHRIMKRKSIACFNLYCPDKNWKEKYFNWFKNNDFKILHSDTIDFTIPNISYSMPLIILQK